VSTETPIEALGPEPFRFIPAAGPVEGPAFSRTFRTVTTLLVLSVGIWLALVWQGERAHASRGLLVWFLAAFVMVVFFWWWILRSRTRIDSQALHQTWFADKHMAVADLATVGLVRIRGLEWLIAPRLQARTLMGKYAVFQAADPVVLDEFARLERELAAFRRGQKQASGPAP
jgi:hypothetical protein